MEQFDIVVIGAGPAGCQAAISAAHQMHHVLVLDAGLISRRKGRAYWSKSVTFEDVPVFDTITGPALTKQLHGWLAARPVRDFTMGGRQRKTGIVHRGGVALALTPHDNGFTLKYSSEPLAEDAPLTEQTLTARAVVVASGFEDGWPDIEVDPSAVRVFERYKAVLRYAGNAKGWHTCIRCDGHLHVDQPMALLGVGDDIFYAVIGARDFTEKLTVLTNGRPHGFSSEQRSQLSGWGVEIVETPILRHIGKGTQLLGVALADGSELFFDGFLVDEGLVPNTGFLSAWDYQTDEEGLIITDENRQLLTPNGDKIPGLFAAGDLLSGERNLIATAFALGQDAGLAASDTLRLP